MEIRLGFTCGYGDDDVDHAEAALPLPPTALLTLHLPLPLTYGYGDDDVHDGGDHEHVRDVRVAEAEGDRLFGAGVG